MLRESCKLVDEPLAAAADRQAGAQLVCYDGNLVELGLAVIQPCSGTPAAAGPKPGPAAGPGLGLGRWLVRREVPEAGASRRDFVR
ncbi:MULTISPECIES: hypothetical protein [unclassified Amycolatopsis]|uniref:hypothetical protein n=1 Tax=unclassified Amycolatopsis TaxID=2618356 RepID=UPI001C696641|nr:hypothetical protein [Amycolatopsis sp. DSM 110486]QYN19088.1 hypothetical protein K1T34_41520 [Amycolatopsis sp. DSM 110486]